MSVPNNLRFLRGLAQYPLSSILAEKILNDKSKSKVDRKIT